MNLMVFNCFYAYMTVFHCDICWHYWWLFLRQVYEEFCKSSQAHSVEKLIETFIEAKSTGTDKPG